jgi:hypothetical protein
LNSIVWLKKLQNQQNGACIYGGDANLETNGMVVRAWKGLPDLF